jgi:hypothetical protein
MEWSDAMFKEACRHREATVPSYDLMTVVPVHLTADDVAAILTQTRIARTKKLRPRLEAMAAEEATIDLEINEWSSVMLALCGPDREHESVHRHLLRIAMRIANQLAEALGIDQPRLPAGRMRAF